MKILHFEFNIDLPQRRAPPTQSGITTETLHSEFIISCEAICFGFAYVTGGDDILNEYQKATTSTTFTTTWRAALLPTLVTHAEVSLENIYIFQGDRQGGRRVRGIAPYVKSELLQRRFSHDFNTDSSFSEIVTCQIPHPSQHLTVLGVYRSPTFPEIDGEQIVSSMEIPMLHT